MILVAEYYNKKIPEGFLVSAEGEGYVMCFKENPTPRDIRLTKDAETRWIDLSRGEERRIFKILESEKITVIREDNIARIYISPGNERKVAKVIIALRITR